MSISSINKEKHENYEAFVEKFKVKKTTDECYTPPQVYEAVLNWVVKEYGLDGFKIVRPFYPGGDYESFNYTDDCVVIDNPPFSIISKIKNFYNEKGVKFFLFAPHLTLFAIKDTSYIITDARVTYENGAVVNTDFITNLEQCRIRISPGLRNAVRGARKEKENKNPKYTYPKNVISAALLSRYIGNNEIKIGIDECYFIRELDSQKKYKKSLFGSGFLVSDNVVKRLEKERLEKERLEKERLEKEHYCWELSDRELEIVKNLSKDSTIPSQ